MEYFSPWFYFSISWLLKVQKGQGLIVAVLDGFEVIWFKVKPLSPPSTGEAVPGRGGYR
jgi:hypothetical protein